MDLEFDEDDTFEYIEDQLNIGNRIPGTQEREDCANYFISKFKTLNRNFTYLLHNFKVHSTECQNVVFKLNNNKDKNNIVILGAHYDSRAKATKDNKDSDKPVPGANDGASGSAILIELARALYRKKAELDCQIWFVFFDAEDQGRDEGGYGIDNWNWCEGSEKFVKDIENFYDSEKESFDCMVLLDMVGGENLEFINEQISTSSLLDELFTIGRKLGYTNEFPLFPTSSEVMDDHQPFINEGIPSADLIINFWDNSDWPYHHTCDDDLSHISKRSLEVTGKTIEQFIYNNYLDESKDIYNGNYPWDTDINVPNTEIAIFLGILLLIIAGIIISIYLARKEKLKKQRLTDNKSIKGNFYI